MGKRVENAFNVELPPIISPTPKETPIGEEKPERPNWELCWGVIIVIICLGSMFGWL